MEEAFSFGYTKDRVVMFGNYDKIKAHVDLIREKKMKMKNDIERIEQILQSKVTQDVKQDEIKDLAKKYCEYICLCDALIEGIDIMCSMLKH